MRATLRQHALLLAATSLAWSSADAKPITSPAWYGKPACATCVYGQSPGLESEAEALTSAVQNAYEELAEAKFGAGVAVQESQVTRNGGTSYESTAVRNTDLRGVPSTRRKKATAYDDASGKWYAWVLLEFKASDIKKELKQRRQIADKVFSDKLGMLTVTRQVGHATELSGQLLVKGVPRNGRVTLDGELVATADSLFKSVGIGQYQLRLESLAHHPLQASIEVEPGRRTVIELEPAPLESKVTITTDPPRAVVFLDDKRIGISPVTITTAAGRHELRIQKTAYQCKTLLLDLSADEAVTYTVRLDAGKGGSCGTLAH